MPPDENRPARRPTGAGPARFRRRSAGQTALLSALALIGIFAAVTVADLAGPDRPPTDLEAAAKQLAGARAIKVTGQVTGLYPGGRGTIRVRLRNRSGTSVRVRSLAVGVRDANPGCSGRNLAFGRFRGRLRVPARTTRFLRLPVVMGASTPSACQGARFPLRFRFRVAR